MLKMFSPVMEARKGRRYDYFVRASHPFLSAGVILDMRFTSSIQVYSARDIHTNVVKIVYVRSLLWIEDPLWRMHNE